MDAVSYTHLDVYKRQAYVWLIGPIVLVQIAITTAAALLAEAFMLKLLDKPLGLFLGDGSAIVTAWLIALALPPLAPWWLLVVGALFAIVVAKHLYGCLLYTSRCV